MRMTIVCDDKIPYIREALKHLADNVVYLPGSEITANDVRKADALIVRTRTRCNKQLLEDSRVQLVVTATIGHDHIDKEWLEANHIAWTNCPGCNARSVAQWVLCSLLALSEDKGVRLQALTLGIVGHGHVGRAVEQALRPYVRNILLCDPPLAAECSNPSAYHSLAELQEHCDIISLHVPLTDETPWPTLHMIDESFFSKITKPLILMNSSRGAVVDNAALVRALDSQCITHALIDVWEGEPQINTELLERAYIATPHIAGYSADGKANASRMVCEAVQKHFHLQQADLSTLIQLPEATQTNTVYSSQHPLYWYDPRIDTQNLKANPDRFEWLRGNYHVRREQEKDL